MSSSREESRISRKSRSWIGAIGQTLLGRVYQPLVASVRRSAAISARPTLAVRTALVPLVAKHVSGPVQRFGDEEDLVVACVVRDGEPWLESYLDHYRRMGVKHFVFLENESVDATVRILQSAGNDVTLFQSRRRFRYWEFAFKRWLVERFAGDGWILLADVDEFFDYPRSSALSLRGFLRYLNAGSFSGVAVQMLDLFSLESPFDTDEADSREAHRFYDLDSIVWRPFEGSGPGGGYGGLTRSSEAVRKSGGGIQAVTFGFAAPLTKMALLRPSKGIRLTNAHWARGVHLADVSAVFLHYKYVNGFIKRLRAAVQARSHWGGSRSHEWSLDVIEKDDSTRFMRPTAREYQGVDRLVEERYLVVSPAFEEYCQRKDESTVE